MLTVREQRYWAAFQALQKTRGRLPSGALAPITFVEMAAYADLMGLRSIDQRHDLARFIRELDFAYLSFYQERAINK